MHLHSLKQFVYETLCNYRKWHASFQKKALPFSPFHTVILIFDESWIPWLRWKYGWINLSGIKDASECAFVLVRYSRDDSCIRHELRDSLTEHLWKGMVMEESLQREAFSFSHYSNCPFVTFRSVSDSNAKRLLQQSWIQSEGVREIDSLSNVSVKQVC